ncbi:MAG: hypothetical protein HY553_11300 [Elusimicrobia bacterium]|nr:hypothetical protein [Elusimicrobiota bacterium]
MRLPPLAAVASLLLVWTGPSAGAEEAIGFGSGQTLEPRSALAFAAARAARDEAPRAASTRHRVVLVSGDPSKPLVAILKSAEVAYFAGSPDRARCGDTQLDVGVGDVFTPYARRRRVPNVKLKAAVAAQPAPGTWDFSGDASQEGGRCAYSADRFWIRFAVTSDGRTQDLSVFLDARQRGKYAGNYHLADCRREVTVTRTRNKYEVPLNVVPRVVDDPQGPLFEVEQTSEGLWCQVDRDEFDGRMSLFNGRAEIRAAGGASETRVTVHPTELWRQRPPPSRSAAKTYELAPLSYPDAASCEQARSTFAGSWGNTYWQTFGMKTSDDMAACAPEADAVALRARITFDSWRGDSYLPKAGDSIPFSGPPPQDRSYPIGAPDFHYRIRHDGADIDPAVEARMKRLLEDLSTNELRIRCGEFQGTNSWRSCPVRFEFLK